MLGSDDLVPSGVLGGALGLPPGQAPFPWQLRLLDAFLRGKIPRSLDVPTGLGKTAAIAIWLLARARGAPLPRRLVYVVDRRAVVDQATEVALRLRGWLSEHPEMHRGLDLDGRPLPISTLRGHFVDNREWLEDPTTPAIIVATVDMAGSRLLFEGYGTSRKMRPYHAALLGHDSLFMLDEAHLVPPFERLLERITGNRAGLEGDRASTAPPPRLLSLSATGRSQGGVTFTLDAEDLEHPVVRRRLDARKRLTLRDLPDGAELPDTLAERAWGLAGEGQRPIRCLVFADRREHAEKALQALVRLAELDRREKDKAPSVDVELLVGGRRVFERTEAAERLRSLGFLAGSPVARQRPAFLFATSAGEVGIDLDADHAVCDLVPWERMVQRLGRVNRRGEGDAHVEVCVDSLERPDETEACRRAAVRTLIERLPVLDEAALDASPGALRTLQSADRDLVTSASTPEPLYPPLEGPTLQAWAMTSLIIHPGRPAVAPWLRGWVDARPQTTLLWRAMLPIAEGGSSRPADLGRFFEAAPPHASEHLEAESFHVLDWLGKRVRRLLSRAAKAAREDLTVLRPDRVAAVILRRDEDPRTVTLRQLEQAPRRERERLLHDTTIVLDARVGGLDRGLLDPTADDVPQTLDGETWLEPRQDEPPPVRFRLRTTEDVQPLRDRNWRERERFVVRRGADGEALTWLVVDKWRQDAATEEDRSAGRPQPLEEHQEWAEAKMRRIAGRLDLAPEVTEILALAARVHDEGKRTWRWQAAFHADSDAIYAKTRGPVNVRLLDGYRHEFGSLLLAARRPEIAALPPDRRDLVLHLIASHHGFARPVISTRGCDAPPSDLEDRLQEVALRFGRLQRTWGPWGLAWWEALLRAADQQASRDNDSHDRVGEES